VPGVGNRTLRHVFDGHFDAGMRFLKVELRDAGVENRGVSQRAPRAGHDQQKHRRRKNTESLQRPFHREFGMHENRQHVV
jgi:hypothetical protein